MTVEVIRWNHRGELCRDTFPNGSTATMEPRPSPWGENALHIRDEHGRTVGMVWEDEYVSYRVLP
jgi:hypothetical protein